ncbi:RNA-directed DNA polymerase (Reverse transcriptase) [Trifolium medium]|uniref:RNA-directed DNA polymerase (Reverse transcriptase) n=1 Tax=Trifolium medium TaxID=97028 RepID=A0A392MU44_9FABA|nr:RNA-directed DNA polymerase (Reverse transcriptase) [Trifolium medium]
MYIGDFKIKQDVHLFELGGIDVVLGIEWLKTLGDTIINWKQQTMSFWAFGKWVTLKSKRGCKKSDVALQSILGKPKSKKEGVMWEIEGVEPKVELEVVLGEYVSVFQTPLSLPPRRDKEHVINLVDGSSGICATRSLCCAQCCLFCSCFLLLVARRAGEIGAARRAALFRALWLLVPALRAGWCCAARRLGLEG